MKKVIFLLSCIFLIQSSAFSQDRKSLIGTWYGKIKTYQFKQDGNAQYYTKRKIAGWQQELAIDKRLNYVYTEYYRGDTIRSKGHVDLTNDTLKFLVTQTNQPGSQSNFESSYPLYFLNNSELIYSNFPVRKIIKEDTEDKIFQKVEVEAVYSLGNDEFLKILYAFLATQALSSKDSVKINSYKVKIDSLGIIDVTTLQSIHADHEYFNAIKQGLSNLKNDFIPAMQNGKPVTAYMTFRITY
ncbi:MAG: hypothetical protein ABI685_01450 [Ferruginibacter sp.]